MSGEQLTALKEQLVWLTAQEKRDLARFLEDEAARDSAGASQPIADPQSAARTRAQHMAWLKAHREEYAGRYVALDGDRLVGSGATIREAHDMARRSGIEHPFLTHISSANDAPFGGW